MTLQDLLDESKRRGTKGFKTTQDLLTELKDLGIKETDDLLLRFDGPDFFYEEGDTEVLKLQGFIDFLDTFISDLRKDDCSDEDEIIECTKFDSSDQEVIEMNTELMNEYFDEGSFDLVCELYFTFGFTVIVGVGNIKS
jgi:hypothetical protein